jgi:hypothetical protein
MLLPPTALRYAMLRAAMDFFVLHRCFYGLYDAAVFRVFTGLHRGCGQL